MVCYGALQEVATYLAYKAQKDKATGEGDKVLEAIFFFLSRDEAAHVIARGDEEHTGVRFTVHRTREVDVIR